MNAHNRQSQSVSPYEAAVCMSRDHGWHVFPAPPGKKLSYEKAADNHGHRWGASSDPEEVGALFARHPGANVGIATQESGLVVIDCDTKNEDPETGQDGVSWFAEKVAEHGDWPETVEAISPSGSWHIYFRYPEDFDPKTCDGEIAVGVDVRGHGGMVIAPPSVKPGADAAYRWKNPPTSFPVAPAPQWVLDLLPRREKLSDRAKAPGKPNGTAEGAPHRIAISGASGPGSVIEKYRRWIRGAGTDGQKHAATRDIAASLAAQGVSERFTTALIMEICPVWDDNLRKSIESGYAKFRCTDSRHVGLDLVRDDKDRPIWNVANAVTLLSQHPDWEGVLAFNAFTGRRMVLTPVPETTEGHRPLDDDDYTTATAWFNRNGFPKASEAVVAPALRHACTAATYNPLTDFLGLLEWDGTERVGRWLIEYCGAADTRFIREAGTRWMISAVARAHQPGCKVDAMLVLEGDQGIGKSSGIRALAGAEFFGDNLPDMSRKDAQEYVRGQWIIEVAELVAARRDIETVKAFISRQEDEFRWSHGRECIPRPRQCVFVGTTNDDKYLRDETGNRRFWPVRVEKIDGDRMREDRTQLWAEAVQLYRRGVQWWLPPDVEGLARDEQAKRLDVDPWHDDVVFYLGGKDYVSPREVLVHALHKEPKEITRKDSDRVAGLLRTLGFDRDPNDAKVTSGEFKSYPKYKRRAP